MKKVRVNLTVDWDKSVVDATKVSEIKDGIRNELEAIASEAFADLNPTDFKIRFLRGKNTKRVTNK